jgi:hypothetical protein
MRVIRLETALEIALSTGVLAATWMFQVSEKSYGGSTVIRQYRMIDHQCFGGG